MVSLVRCDSSLAACRWFDVVVVLTTDNTVLYQRLERRGYHQAKIQENVQCEIMHVSIEEARAAYKCVCRPRHGQRDGAR